MQRNELIKKLDILENTIRDCGHYARERQAFVNRNYKADGTVLTEVDLYVSKTIEKTIHQLFPLDNFISEESINNFKEDSEFTFILDPIDGTDAYSQGLPSWAISLGILSSKRIPIGSIIYAPRFGIGKDDLFLRRNPLETPTLNGELIKVVEKSSEVSMIAMEATCRKVLDFSNYQGGFRVFGSAVLHMLAPVIYPYYQGSVHTNCYVWDVAGTHAILLGVGYDIEYSDGNKFVYNDDLLIKRKKYPKALYSGPGKIRKQFYKILPRKA